MSSTNYIQPDCNLCTLPNYTNPQGVIHPECIYCGVAWPSPPRAKELPLKFGRCNSCNQEVEASYDGWANHSCPGSNAILTQPPPAPRLGTIPLPNVEEFELPVLEQVRVFDSNNSLLTINNPTPVEISSNTTDTTERTRFRTKEILRQISRIAYRFL